MHSDYEGGILSRAKYNEFHAEAVQRELAREARRGRKENRLVQAWHSLQIWVTELKLRRKSSENHQEWSVSAEAPLRK